MQTDINNLRHKSRGLGLINRSSAFACMPRCSNDSTADITTSFNSYDFRCHFFNTFMHFSCSGLNFVIQPYSIAGGKSRGSLISSTKPVPPKTWSGESLMGTDHEGGWLGDPARSHVLCPPRGANHKSRGTLIRTLICLLSAVTLYVCMCVVCVVCVCVCLCVCECVCVCQCVCV